MKKLRVLLSVVTVVVALFSITVIASAESAIKFVADEITYTEGETLVVTIKSNSTATIAGGGYFNVGYDKAAWEYAGFAVDNADAKFASLEQYIDTDYISYTLHPNNDITLVADETIVELKFNLVNKANAGENDFWFTDDECFTDTSYNPIAYAGSLATKAAAQAPVITGTPTRENFTVGDTTYTEVWVGAYDITLNGNAINKAVVTFAEHAPFEVATSDVEGDGEVSFKIAIVGVPKTVAAPTVTIQ